MRFEPLVATVAAIFALGACSQASPSNNSAAAGTHVAAPAATAAPANAAAATAQTNASTAASGSRLWGVTEEEDAASHRGIDFIAFNRSGHTITALSLRPDEGPLEPGAQQDPWSANLLSQPELPDGVRAAAHYEADIELCRWQLRATFADRKTRDYPSVNLCDTIRVDLR